MVREAFLVAFTVIGGSLLAVGAIAMAVAWLDEYSARGWSWSLGEGAAGGPPLPLVASSPSVSDGSKASSLCDGCGQLRPPEALPLDLLLWAGGGRPT